MPDAKSKLARMLQPEELRSEEFQRWSRGRGVDVWAMLCAAICGDPEKIRQLVDRDRNLVFCEYEYFTPLRFAVRENQRGVIDFLLEKGADPAYEAGDSLVTIARERGYADLVAFFEALLRSRYQIVPKASAVARAIKGRDPGQARALIEAEPRPGSQGG